MKYDKNLLINEHGSDSGIEKMLYSADPKLAHQKVFMDLSDLKKINRRFMGGGMSQSYAAIYFFEYYYEAHRFEYVVEFGSQKGALSTYFANLAGVTEALFFDTFELYPDIVWNVRKHEGCGHWFSKLESICPYIHAYHQNIFSQKTYDHVKENMQQFKNTFIFCDGGNKIQEFNMYAPLLKDNDRIAVHDWGQEINYNDIIETATKYGLVPDEPYTKSALDLGTLIFAFRKK